MSWEYTAPENPERGGFKVFPKGKYRAELTAYEYGTSANGNGKVTLSLSVFHNDEEAKIKDWLVNTEGMAWKTKAFCEATGQAYGLPLDFDKCLGKQFSVVLKVDEYINKDGVKAESNKVDTYLPFGKSDEMIHEKQPTMSEAGSNIPDSDLPF